MALPQRMHNPIYPIFFFTASQRHEAESAQVKELPEREETCRKKKQHHRENRAARDSGVAQSLEDRDSNCSLTDGYCTPSWSTAECHICTLQWILVLSLLFVLTVCVSLQAWEIKRCTEVHQEQSNKWSNVPHYVLIQLKRRQHVFVRLSSLTLLLNEFLQVF